MNHLGGKWSSAQRGAIWTRSYEAKGEVIIGHFRTGTSATMQIDKGEECLISLISISLVSILLELYSSLRLIRSTHSDFPTLARSLIALEESCLEKLYGSESDHDTSGITRAIYERLRAKEMGLSHVDTSIEST